MNNIEKPMCIIYCTADLRTDRCPARVAGNDRVTVADACIHCEHARVHHLKRGQSVAEMGAKGTDEVKEWRADK